MERGMVNEDKVPRLIVLTTFVRWREQGGTSNIIVKGDKGENVVAKKVHPTFNWRVCGICSDEDQVEEAYEAQAQEGTKAQSMSSTSFLPQRITRNMAKALGDEHLMIFCNYFCIVF